MANLEVAGHQADVLGCSVALADIRITQGRLRDAQRTYERGLRIGDPSGGETVRGTADMHVGLAGLYRERNDLASANRHLEAAIDLGDALGLPQNAYRQRVAMAGVREADGDLDAAIELLDEAEARYDADFFPEVRPIPAMRARRSRGTGAPGRRPGLGARSGRVARRRAVLHPRVRSRDAGPALLAEGVRDRADASLLSAIHLAERLAAAAEAGGRGGSLIHILVVWRSGGPSVASMRPPSRPSIARRPWRRGMGSCGCSSTKGPR